MKIKHIFILTFLWLLCIKNYAQTTHYIYIQTVVSKVFYVSINDKKNTSNNDGYLLVNKINKGKQVLTLGFPNAYAKECLFIIDVNDDKGFSLKQAIDSSWYLFDLTQNSVIKPLADKTLDSLLIIQKNSLPKPSVVKVLEKDPTKVITPKIEEKKPLVTNYSLTKLFEKFTTKGVDVEYIDSNSISCDTIVVFVPMKIAKSTVKAIEAEKKAKLEQPIIKAADNKIFEQTKLDMASCSSEQEMLGIASKAIMSKTFSVLQTKTLSNLFLWDDNKLKFFSIMKNGVSDINNFYLLANELTIPKNEDAFKELLKKP